MGEIPRPRKLETLYAEEPVHTVQQKAQSSLKLQTNPWLKTKAAWTRQSRRNEPQMVSKATARWWTKPVRHCGTKVIPDLSYGRTILRPAIVSQGGGGVRARVQWQLETPQLWAWARAIRKWEADGKGLHFSLRYILTTEGKPSLKIAPWLW